MSRVTRIELLMGSQSAFCIRDLISLASAGSQPSELGRIYEWYSSRTAKAIATSYAVATLAAGALVKYLADDGRDIVAVLLLAGVIVVAALAGLFQLAELAQLPRELAESTRLLASLSWLTQAGVDLGRPPPSTAGTNRLDWLIWLGALVWWSALTVVVAKATKHSDVDAAVAAIACALIVVFVRRICEEFPPTSDAPSEETRDGELHKSLFEQIGAYRLDEYVTYEAIANDVNYCIDRAKSPEPDADG